MKLNLRIHLVGSERRRRWRDYRRMMKKRKRANSIKGGLGYVEVNGQKLEVISWEITRK